MDLNDFLDIFCHDVRLIKQFKGNPIALAKALNVLIKKSKGLVLKTMVYDKEFPGYKNKFRTFSLLRGLTLLATMGSFIWLVFFVRKFSFWTIIPPGVLIVSELFAFLRRYLVRNYLLYVIRNRYDDDVNRPKRFYGLFDYGDKIQMLLFSEDDKERAFVVKNKKTFSIFFDTWQEDEKRGGKWVRNTKQSRQVEEMEEAIGLIKEQPPFKNNSSFQKTDALERRKVV